jgi:predicted dehydrogenase
VTGGHLVHQIGLVGCGSFGTFVARAVGDVAGAQLVAVADTDRELARRLADQIPGARPATDLDSLLSSLGVDVVVITTPPWTHADLAVQALDAGCHVLVEKPLAIDVAGCRRVAEAARANDRVVAVDHMLRFAPLVLVLDRLLAVESRGQRVLGTVRRFSFENDATDDGLPAGHWFWDPARSGGIFVEHGVHFFDLACWLVGAKVESVQAITTGLVSDDRIDTVVATAIFESPATATWYHSFSHPRRCERQRLRLDLGTAECRLDGWIPLELRIDAWSDADGTAALSAAAEEVAGELGIVIEELDAQAGRLRLLLAHPAAEVKDAVYARCISALVADLLGAIDEGRPPRVDIGAASSAVALAVAATEAAARGQATAVGPPSHDAAAN